MEPNSSTADTILKIELKSSLFMPIMFMDLMVAWNSAASSIPGTGRAAFDKNG